MSNQNRERIVVDDPLHEGPSDQHRHWDRLATESRARGRQQNTLADLRSVLRNAFHDPVRRAEIAGILAEKKGS